MIVEYLENLPLQIIVLYAVLTVSFIVQLVYYLFVFIKPSMWKRKEESREQQPISIIICAKNEYSNLKNNLPKILSQNYREYEVLVVNDCSTDDSEMLLGELSLKYKNLRYTNIEQDKKFMHGKKLAITVGLKGAKYNRLVFTDADCFPISEKWLDEINKSYTVNKHIVLAFGGYEKQKGLLNRVIRYDTHFVATQYLSFAMLGRPYMGIGRNMSYEKEVFFSGKGFTSHYHILSGDDDLFINENAKKKNTSVVLSKNSFTLSKPEQTWRAWVKQKKRHLTTGKYYKFGDKFFLGLEYLTRFTFYLALLLGLFFYNQYYILAGVFGFRLLVQLIVTKINMRKLNQRGFWLLTPFLDVLLPIFYLLFAVSNKFNSSKNRWK